MEINEYQQLALRTANPTLSWSEQLQNGLMGLNGEAGEAIDLLKKSLFQGHQLDRERMAKELGDVAWYLAVSADSLGIELETILQMNIDKLKARYPNGFDSIMSRNRDAKDL
jgi:NTP pyrophosphatase (non-canonical NTP hydrolase)